jgi:hypothetical protein
MALDRSPTRLLSANRVAFWHNLAIPIRAETCRLMEVGKSHDDESENEHHHKSKQDARDVSAGQVPLRPSHLSIHSAFEASLLLCLAIPEGSVYVFY